MRTSINLDKLPCMQDLYESQVDRTPEAVALISGEQRLTYNDLDCRANQFAHHLRMLGVMPEMLVGICTTRSVEMVIGILGILKAGGAYVPLDPSYPQERLSLILKDAHAEFAITQARFLQMFSNQGIKTISLDCNLESIISKLPAHRLPRVGSPENLAYVIYTSGSTGKPKGVMITHSNLCHFVRIACSALEVTPDDVYLHTASIAYALSVRQLMVPLAYGATIVLATRDESRDPILLFNLIKRQRVTLIDMVPSFWRTCIQRLSDLPHEERKGLLDNVLRRIVSIGEPLLSDLPRDWAFKFGHNADLVNIFGQTETTGVVATYPIVPELQNAIEIVPIGTSVSETELYILDPNLNPVARGMTGELCVSSPCLARGYLNQAELTSQKFISNPFKDMGGNRLYRTGDMARYRDDGCIEFLGRSDFQVKIRGQRLELGEVEAVLSEHEALQACVVVAHGQQPDDKRLTAFIVCAPNRDLTPAGLRYFMRQRVPDYMVPTSFIFVDSLPLTPNGKVDRLALANFACTEASTQSEFASLQNESVQPSTKGTFVPPRNQLEKTIACIWQSLLKISEVGIHDNFFDLGGHSLMAVRMFTRIEHDLGVRLPLTSLCFASSVAQLAELIEQWDEVTTNWTPVVPIQTYGNKPPFFGIHGHEGGVLFWRDLVAHLPDDQPFYAIQAQGVDGDKPALMSIPDMATQYLVGIRDVQPRGPYFIGGYSMGGEIALEVAQQLFKQGEQVDLLVMFDTANPVRSSIPSVLENVDSPTSIQALNSNNRYRMLRQKFIYHTKRLSEKGVWGKLSYIFHQALHQIYVLTIFTFAKTFMMVSKRLPDPLLLRYLRVSHSKALQSYTPAVYPGKITLFRASQSLNANTDDSPLGWKAFAGGGFEVYHFAATHNIMNAEYAIEIAEKLNECLAAAQV